MTFSLNNRIIIEQYVKEGLKATQVGPLATPSQRDGLKGLTVLVDADVMVNGVYKHVPRGSTVYIREEVLYTHPWASKPLTCPFIREKFLIVDATYVEFVNTPDDAA